MTIPGFYSIEIIKKQYVTGEQPVLVRCSDLNEYVCKYMRSSATPYKLICEVIDAVLASEWGLSIPDFAFIKLLPEHWTPFSSVNLSAPAFGSKVSYSVIDVTSNWNDDIQVSDTLREQIANIALFDLWIANEDRNWNNTNLLYDVIKNNFVVIDHGCILNTATFDFNLSLLTQNETILYSDLADHILREILPESSERMVLNLRNHFNCMIEGSNDIITKVLDNIPEGWKVNPEIIRKKLLQLFDKEWADKCWDTFVEYYKETING